MTREQFEKFILENIGRFPKYYDVTNPIRKGPEDEYLEDAVQCAWLAIQASAEKRAMEAVGDRIARCGYIRKRKRMIFRNEREAKAFVLGVGWEAREGEVIDVLHGSWDGKEWYAEPGWSGDHGLPVVEVKFDPKLSS